MMCDCGRGGVCPGCSRSAMLEARSAENAETCAIHDMDQHTRALVRERLRYHAAHGAMCDMRDERDALRAALIRCAEIAGTDGESIEAGRSGALRHPEVSELAVEDLRGHGLAHVAANDDLARDVVALQAEVVRLREALEAAEDALRGCVPWVGTSGRGAAQEALAVACDLVGYDATDWTSHPDVLERRRAALKEDA